MKKLALLGAVAAVTFGLSTATVANAYMGAPAGFGGANSPNTVAMVKKNAFDEQIVTLRGRLTNYLGYDRYEFSDNTGSIEVELDNDRNWSYISRGQLIDIIGEVDRDFFFTTIDVKQAVPVQTAPANAAPGVAAPAAPY